MCVPHTPVRPDTVDEVETALVALLRAVGRLTVETGPGQPTLERARYVALAQVCDHSPVRATELATLLGVDASTASRTSASLVDLGLVERSADPEDGRASLLRPTALGRETCATVRRGRHGLLEELLATWSPHDRATFADLLVRFTTDLTASTSQGAR